MPNVVFILADDLGWGEVGCFGQSKIPTPNIDRIAAQGMRLTQHYSGAPVCAPARCVLMTGKHLGHAEIRGNQQTNVTFPEFTEGQHPISDGAVTLAEVLKHSGYATGCFGKWGLGPVGSTGDPNRQGFDQFFGYNCQAVAHSYYPRYLWKNDQQIEINPQPKPGHVKEVTGDVKAADYMGTTYAPYVIADEAVRFIDEHKSQPFFLYFTPIEPHVAMHPPQAAVDRFPKEWDSQQYHGESGYLPNPRPRAAYAAMINDLDNYVGRILDALDAAGVADNTLLVFTSDNGTTHDGKAGWTWNIGGVDAEFFNSTAGLRGFKGSVYEGGLRVPTVVRFPGKIAAGTRSDSPGYFADWFPTICDACGIAPPAALDGENLWPVLCGKPATSPRKPMVWVFPEYGGQVAVRIGDHKVIRRNLNEPKNIDPWEVYDLAHDRNETINIARQNPELVQAAFDVLKKEATENPVFPVQIQ